MITWPEGGCPMLNISEKLMALLHLLWTFCVHIFTWRSATWGKR